MRVTAVAHSNAVDLYNSASGTWSTAQLSVGRWRLAATSVGNVAIFAGGESNFSLTLFVEGLLFGMMSVGDGVTLAWLRRAACCLSYLRCRRLPSHGRHCRYWISDVQCCGIVQQCIGYMVDCATQRDTHFACCDICWERGHLCGGFKHRWLMFHAVC